MRTSKCCCNFEPPTLRCSPCSNGNHEECNGLVPHPVSSRPNAGIPEKRTPGRCKWWAKNHQFFPGTIVAAKPRFPHPDEMVEVIVQPTTSGDATVYSCSRCHGVWNAVDVERSMRTEA